MNGPMPLLRSAATLPARARRGLCVALLALTPLAVQAGNQQYEPMAASVQASLQAAISDSAHEPAYFEHSLEAKNWLQEMSRRLEKRIPDENYRTDLLKTVHYEATRAGLDPQMVLGLIQVESAFRKYAVSSSGARGYMQVMPFWVKLIGNESSNLFHMRTNLRFGCTILRHYLDIEKGDLFRALGRYNGSLGKPEYPNLVRTAWVRNWNYDAPRQVADSRNSAR